MQVGRGLLQGKRVVDAKDWVRVLGKYFAVGVAVMDWPFWERL